MSPEPELRILLVDASAPSTDALAHELARTGQPAEIRRVASLEDLRDALIHEAWEVVLLDTQVPGLPGRDALAQVTHMAPQVPVVIVSGELDETTAVDLLRHGAWDFVSKNRLERLRPVVDAACAQVAERRAAAIDGPLLAERERRMALLVGALPAITWETDTTLLITQADGLGLRAAGQDPTRIAGQTVGNVLGDRERGPIVDYHRRALAGESVEVYTPAWGRRYWARYEPVWSGDEIVGVSGTAVDLTHLLEEADADRASMARAVFDNASDALMVADDDRQQVQVNSAATQIFGMPKDELEALRVDDLFSGDAEEAWKAFMAEGRMAGEFDYTRPDGEVRRLEFTAQANVAPGRHLSIMRDVTERKRLEEALLESQRLEAVGRLAGGIAHDFNNLLTAVSGYADLALARLAPDEPARRHVEGIAQAGARAAALTSQLLAFGRRQSFDPIVVEVNDIVVSREKLLRRLIPANIVIEFQLASDLPLVKADPSRLEQVLVNLAVNGCDAMPDGGTLTIASRRATFGATDERPAGLEPATYAHLTVSDTGRGIAAEHLPRIFEPFFTTKTEAVRGTGLGLATVYGSVKQSGGFVAARSTPGEGAAFDVYLPSIEVPAPRPAAENGDAVPRGTERILIVEDEELVRGLAAEMLEAQGYDVVAAADGTEALEVLGRQGEEIDLLFTDVVMPGMSGDELARESRLARPQLPVLFASGYTDRTIGAEWAVGPEIPFLQKPYSRSAVACKVREVLDATA